MKMLGLWEWLVLWAFVSHSESQPTETQTQQPLSNSRPIPLTPRSRERESRVFIPDGVTPVSPPPSPRAKHSAVLIAH